MLVLTQANAVSQEAVDNKVDGAGGEVRDAGLCHKCAVWVLDNPEKKRLVLEDIQKPCPLNWTKIVDSNEGDVISELVTREPREQGLDLSEEPLLLGRGEDGKMSRCIRSFRMMKLDFALVIIRRLESEERSRSSILWQSLVL